MDAKRSGLHLLLALVFGAVLGIAANIAIKAIVDTVPDRFDEALGTVFFVLLAVLVLSLVVRLLAALFSATVRASIAAHEVAHAVWFGAAIIIVAFAFLSQKMWPPLDSPNPWGSQRPRYQGRTMAQWLKILASEPGRPGSPLDIIGVHVDTNFHTTFLEVPLSCDLLREYDFLDGIGKIRVIIDGGFKTVHHLGETNGNCLLELDWEWEHIPPGLHNVEVDFNIWPSPYNYLHARGPTHAITFPNIPTSH